MAERLEQFGARAGGRLQPAFLAAGVRYPPAQVALVVFKDSRTLELYARNTGRPWRYIKTYPVLAASGKPGPKLAEGDHQVPEGLYRVESLNPNSRFHLSLRLNYPNEFDRLMARQDGRAKLGGDIMIHGSAVSVGCLAMGDDAVEELFVLAALVGREPIRVAISPTDFRTGTATTLSREPRWLSRLYGALREELRQFRKGAA